MRGALTGLSSPCTANVSFGEVASRSPTHVAPEHSPSPHPVSRISHHEILIVSTLGWS